MPILDHLWNISQYRLSDDPLLPLHTLLKVLQMIWVLPQNAILQPVSWKILLLQQQRHEGDEVTALLVDLVFGSNDVSQHLNLLLLGFQLLLEHHDASFILI